MAELMVARNLGVQDLDGLYDAIKDAHAKWFEIGMELKLDMPAIQRIQLENHDNSSTCLKKMLRLWLTRVNPTPTLEALSNTLRQRTIGYSDAAANVDRYQNQSLPTVSCPDVASIAKPQYLQLLPAASLVSRAEINSPNLPEMIAFPGKHGKVNIIREIGTDYYNFGVLLLNDRSGARVNAITHMYSYNAERVGREVFQLWLQGSGRQPVSWQTLFNVLTEAGLTTVARIIEVAKETGCTFAPQEAVANGVLTGTPCTYEQNTFECTTEEMIMATDNVEILTIRKNRKLICGAVGFCADINWFAKKMMEESFISPEIHTNTTTTPGVSIYEKCNQLLCALEVHVLANPKRFYDFLAVLSQQPALQTTVHVLQQSHELLSKQQKLKSDQQRSDGNTCSSDSASPPEMTISIIQSHSDFAIFMSDITEMLEENPKTLTRMKRALKNLVLPLPYRIGRLAHIVKSKEYQEATTVDMFLELLAPHWSPVDCSLLQTLVRASHCQPAVRKLEEFLSEQKKISRFLILQQAQQQVDKTHDQSATTQGEPSPTLLQVESEYSQAQQHKSYQEVTLKVDKSVLTMKDYDEMADHLSSTLKLPRYSFTVEKIETGSIVIIWQISRELIPYIQSIRISDGELKILAKQRILEIRITGIIIIYIPSLEYWEGGKRQDAPVTVTTLAATQEDHIQPEEALLKACSEGRLKDVTTLLTQVVDVNARDTEARNTALIRASREGHSDIVKELLVAGADVDLQNEYGDTALHWASYSGHIKTVQELLKGHANVNIVNKNNGTALMEACSEGHHKVANILISAGTQVDLRSGRGSSALLLASLRGLTTTVNELLKKGVDVNVQNEDGLTSLIAAAKNKHSDVVRLLLDAEADTEIPSTGGMTPLFFAAAEDSLDIVRLLVEKGADVKAKNSENQTVLDIAHGAVYQELAAVKTGHPQTEEPQWESQADLQREQSQNVSKQESKPAKKYRLQSQIKERFQQIIFEPFKRLALELRLRSKKTEKTSLPKLFSRKHQQKV